jgi:hypothetical protein
MFGSLRNEHETIGDFTRDDFRKLMESQGYLCFWCGVPICERSLDPNCEAQPDHLLTRARGGADFYWNIVASCQQCNKLRGNKLPGEFLRERWAFAQLVGDPEKKSTGIALSRGKIPYHKQRLTPPSEQTEELDEDGNLIVDHLAVSPAMVPAVRYLANINKMDQSKSELERRKEYLRGQLMTLYRRFLVAAGQMELPFDVRKPVSTTEALMATDPQTVVVAKGMHLDRRKA